jgi:hypothetical protein
MLDRANAGKFGFYVAQCSCAGAFQFFGLATNQSPKMT